MKRRFLPVAAAALALSAGLLSAAVVRLAPEFNWEGAGGRPHPLKQLRGQPVVLLIAPSPEAKAFRKEVAHIERDYLDLSARKTVFIAAFTAQTGQPVSNVPFLVAQNGAAVAAAYGAKDAAISVVVIGADGNVDLQSDKPEASQRILDIINNSFAPQAAARQGQ